MKTFKAGAVYFAIVFAMGFVLGTIRTLWVVPLLGVRAAELAEAPVMVVVSILAARWIDCQIGFPKARLKRLASGLVALGLMLITEFSFVLWVRGLTIREYWQSRDPVSGTAYFIALAMFAAIPALVSDQRGDASLVRR